MVRELRQKGPSRAAIAAASAAAQAAPTVEESAAAGDGSKKRKMIVDRFARFKLDEAEDAAKQDGHSKILEFASDSSPIAHAQHIAAVHQLAGSTTSSRNTSFSEGTPARHGHEEGLDGHAVSRPSSTERGEEPYRAMFTMPGEEIIGDAEGRKAYV